MSSRYEFIDAERATKNADGSPRYTVVLMCAWLLVSVSGFYDWLSRPASATAQRRAELRAVIEYVFAETGGRYGYRRVHAVLARGGVACGPELVRSLMGEAGLVPCQPRRSCEGTTVQAGRHASIPDLVERDFTATTPGARLVGDIIYVPTWESWLYVALVIDCYSRKIVGWAMGDNYKTPLIVAAATGPPGI